MNHCSPVACPPLLSRLREEKQNNNGANTVIVFSFYVLITTGFLMKSRRPETDPSYEFWICWIHFSHIITICISTSIIYVFYEVSWTKNYKFHKLTSFYAEILSNMSHVGTSNLVLIEISEDKEDLKNENNKKELYLKGHRKSWFI